MNKYINEKGVEKFLMESNGQSSRREVEEFLTECCMEYYDELEKSTDTIRELKLQCEEYGFDYEELCS
ncbi:hypothetical protein [Clostridium peptidivorans]|uniref:hypothetical protein n=1 Tax=Clostridium peptidivorans TaxID=100174 RepID=UPI000BE2CFCD|nr:hypothetical protein [Clostridium peptidivorans]